MQSLEWLYSLEGRGTVLGLEKIKGLLEKLGNPEKNLKCIHVAGTNGKGSVTAMISKVLELAGHKVGMFTSPHLASFRERIQINSVKISEEEVVRIVEKINGLGIDLTFFEKVRYFSPY